VDGTTRTANFCPSKGRGAGLVRFAAILKSIVVTPREAGELYYVKLLSGQLDREGRSLSRARSRVNTSPVQVDNLAHIESPRPVPRFFVVRTFEQTGYCSFRPCPRLRQRVCMRARGFSCGLVRRLCRPATPAILS
jgi:hypothetical protein